MNELGNLSQCMVDSDADAIQRARRLRRKAILISIVIEAICLAALLIWPLVTPGVLPAMYIATPLPPYRGGGGASANQRNRLPPRVIRDHWPPSFFFRPPELSRRVSDLGAEAAPDLGGAASAAGLAFGLGPISSLIPGGADNGVPFEPPREPKPVRPPTRQKISEGVMAGALIHRVDPRYPEIARAMHLSGEVRLRAIIATDGSIQQLEVLSGSPILARAAEEAVRQWRYRPTLLSGAPVEVDTFITVNFILGQ